MILTITSPLLERLLGVHFLTAVVEFRCKCSLVSSIFGVFLGLALCLSENCFSLKLSLNCVVYIVVVSALLCVCIGNLTADWPVMALAGCKVGSVFLLAQPALTLGQTRLQSAGANLLCYDSEKLTLSSSYYAPLSSRSSY